MHFVDTFVVHFVNTFLVHFAENCLHSPPLPHRLCHPAHLQRPTQNRAPYAAAAQPAALRAWHRVLPACVLRRGGPTGTSQPRCTLPGGSDTLWPTVPVSMCSWQWCTQGTTGHTYCCTNTATRSTIRNSKTMVSKHPQSTQTMHHTKALAPRTSSRVTQHSSAGPLYTRCSAPPSP